MGNDPLVDAALNLTHFHREHEKFYGQEPRADAVTLQRHARALQGLADRWSVAVPEAQTALSPFEGSNDLNDPTALQLAGVLFMEGEGEPAEITKIKNELRTFARGQEETGRWLSNAMSASWATHRIIASDWQAAEMSSLAARLLLRAVDILEHVDFKPASLRDDLAGDRTSPGSLYSAAELIGRAADLLCDGAGLVRDNERRWRVVHARIQQLQA
jgi:hypothetical protein